MKRGSSEIKKAKSFQEAINLVWTTPIHAEKEINKSTWHDCRTVSNSLTKDDSMKNQILLYDGTHWYIKLSIRLIQYKGFGFCLFIEV